VQYILQKTCRIYEQEGLEQNCDEGSWRETETTKENTRDWLDFDERDPEFQLLTEEEIAEILFFT
jgi:hypothetical protein